LSSSIAAEIIKKGFDVFYDTAQRILYSFERARFAKYGSFDYEIIERYISCDLLIIDDLGTEFSGSMSVSSLFNLINTRLIENKSMIISTNLSFQDMQSKYEDRIVSRMLGEFTILNFIGDDIRFKKL
jgi:DNA replication protein DnaC